MTTHERRHVQAYVVLRIDRGAPCTDSERTLECDDALNGDKDCVYYWQSTHLFIDGGSHGAAKAT